MIPLQIDGHTHSSASSSNDNEDHSTRQVRFSDYSTLHIYRADPSYRRCKSYLPSEYQAFRTRAAFEAFRLRQLIEACPFQNAETIRLLINRGIVKREDFLGIEHLISESAHERVVKERRVHSSSLLKRQKELLENNEWDANSLAEVALARSAKSAARARVRAAVAA
ncbi:hypothetical protein HJC23_007887 [Cyclotella cryptica]|uniref:Uncharacterized protein n=1 Tax=Cyclotella cryptica TaxID=29204 RepID=A0ABD3R406_9STRA